MHNWTIPSISVEARFARDSVVQLDSRESVKTELERAAIRFRFTIRRRYLNPREIFSSYAERWSFLSGDLRHKLGEESFTHMGGGA